MNKPPEGRRKSKLKYAELLFTFKTLNLTNTGNQMKEIRKEVQ